MKLYPMDPMKLYPMNPDLIGIPLQFMNIHYNSLLIQQGLSLSQPMSDEAVKVFGSPIAPIVQQLLDEVVSVCSGIGDESKKVNVKSQMKSNNRDCFHVELTVAEKQELQMKKAKLVNMLDEVGQRYKQYQQQMQLVAYSFEAAAGFGSAKAYTALALQTISTQFRCLRDAITGQIKATVKRLGEEELANGLVRQQRALQQLGMIHNNAWRPQRGLPERAVSVLRAWLFEHFLHPYPRDSDKKMLAKQAGLTRSQVSNWFINARVRLWKPMVEEMYTEEMNKPEQSGGNETSTCNIVANVSDAYSSPRSNAQLHAVSVAYNRDDELLMRSKPKRTRDEESMSINGFGEYSVGEIERFGVKQFAPRFSAGTNSISLTLGLTQYGNLSLPIAQTSYIQSNGFSGFGNDISADHPGNSYESRKRFAAQLVPEGLDRYNRIFS